MKKLLSLFTFAFYMGSTANAGILIDPYLSYLTNGSSTFSSTSTVTGTEIGARLGYDFFGFGAGVDALLSGKYNYSTAGINTDVTPAYFGVFLSYKFPILVRGYISYLTNYKETNSASDEYSGTATKIGVQYTGLPFIAIGLETFSGTIGTFKTGAGVSSSISETVSHTNIAVSVPFSF